MLPKESLLQLEEGRNFLHWLHCKLQHYHHKNGLTHKASQSLEQQLAALGQENGRKLDPNDRLRRIRVYSCARKNRRIFGFLLIVIKYYLLIQLDIKIHFSFNFSLSYDIPFVRKGISSYFDISYCLPCLDFLFFSGSFDFFKT